MHDDLKGHRSCQWYGSSYFIHLQGRSILTNVVNINNVMAPWKYVGGVRVFLTAENVTFFHSKLLLYNCKFLNIKDEQLDTITSLILLMLTMLPSLRLISYKQKVSSNQCFCCSTGLKVIVAQDKTSKHGCYALPFWIGSDTGADRQTDDINALCPILLERDIIKSTSDGQLPPHRVTLGLYDILGQIWLWHLSTIKIRTADFDIDWLCQLCKM